MEESGQVSITRKQCEAEKRIAWNKGFRVGEERTLEALQGLLGISGINDELENLHKYLTDVEERLDELEKPSE